VKMVISRWKVWEVCLRTFVVLTGLADPGCIVSSR
jgi:hypothetical protein